MAIDITARGLAINADLKAEAALKSGSAPGLVYDSINQMIEELGATAAENQSYKYTFTNIDSIQTGSSVYLTGAGDPDFWVEIKGDEGRLYAIEIGTEILDNYVQQTDDNITVKSVTIKDGNGSKFLNGRLILCNNTIKDPYDYEWPCVATIASYGSRGGLELKGGDNYMRLYSSYDYPGGFDFYSYDGFVFHDLNNYQQQIEINGTSIRLGDTALTEEKLSKLTSLIDRLSEEDIDKLIKFVSTLTIEEE